MTLLSGLSLLPLLQVELWKKHQVKAHYYTTTTPTTATRRHCCIIICLHLSNHTHTKHSVHWACHGCGWLKLYEVTRHKTSASWMWPWALATKITGGTQTNTAACFPSIDKTKQNKTISHQDQIDKQQSPAIQHFVALSTTTTQMLRMHWHWCRSNAASSDDTLRTTWGMVQIISV